MSLGRSPKPLRIAMPHPDVTREPVLSASACASERPNGAPRSVASISDRRLRHSAQLSIQKASKLTKRRFGSGKYALL